MAPCISIGNQGFESIREENSFYIDKSDFIREWWESADVMTLITRPRRFGKTLNMSMVNCFFSNQYAGISDLFEGLSVWKEEKYRKLQGTYPVIFLSFADVKQTNYEDAVRKIKNIIDIRKNSAGLANQLYLYEEGENIEHSKGALIWKEICRGEKSCVEFSEVKNNWY